MIGRGEVAGHTEAALQALVAVELRAVVEGDCLKLAAHAPDDPGRRCRDFGRGSGLELSDQGETTLALHQRQEAMLGTGAHHGVHFPVADPAALVDDGGALGDVPLAQQDPPRRPAAITLPSHLRHDPGVPEERSSLALVATQASIDRLVTRDELPLGPEFAHDLLRAPTSSQGDVDQAQYDIAELRPAPSPPSSRHGVALSLLGPIGPVMGRPVTPHLSADGATRPPQLLG